MADESQSTGVTDSGGGGSDYIDDFLKLAGGAVGIYKTATTTPGQGTLNNPPQQSQNYPTSSPRPNVAGGNIGQSLVDIVTRYEGIIIGGGLALLAVALYLKYR